MAYALQIPNTSSIAVGPTPLPAHAPPATVLDEVMGWVLYAQGVWAVTGKLDVSFRKPVEIGVPTMATARVTRDRGRLVELAGEIRRERDGLVLASATSVFLRVPEAQARAWQERYVGSQASG